MLDGPGPFTLMVPAGLGRNIPSAEPLAWRLEWLEGVESGRVRPAMTKLTELPSWQLLTAHHRKVRDLHLRTLFGGDRGRAERMTAEAAGLFLDYSKHSASTPRTCSASGTGSEVGIR
jgi:hypothetical protein